MVLHENCTLEDYKKLMYFVEEGLWTLSLNYVSRVLVPQVTSVCNLIILQVCVSVIASKLLFEEH